MTSTNNNNNNKQRPSYGDWGLFLFALLSTSLAAGNVLGWPALQSSLINEGTELTETQLGQIFTVGTWSLYGCRLFYGVARDRFWGTRLTTCVSLLTAAAGSLGLALSDANNAIGLSVSMAFVGFGGGVQLCVQPVAGLFPNSQGIILSSITGAFLVSGLVFLVMSFLSNDREKVFLGFSVLLMGLVVVAAFILPKGQFVDDDASVTEDSEDSSVVVARETSGEESPTQLQEEKHDVESESFDEVEKTEEGTVAESPSNNLSSVEKSPITELQEENQDVVENESSDNDVEETEKGITVKSNSSFSNKNDRSLMEILKSSEYVFLILYFSVTLTALNYYVGTIGFQLEEKGDVNQKYTDIFVLLGAAVAVISPLPGKIADHYAVGVLQGLSLVTLSLSFFILASNASLEIGQVAGFTIYAVARLMALSSFFVNVAKRFGYKHYSTLVGGGLMICATFSLVQAPLIKLSANGKAFAVNVSFGAALLSLLPYCMWLRGREQRERFF